MYQALQAAPDKHICWFSKDKASIFSSLKVNEGELACEVH